MVNAKAPSAQLSAFSNFAAYPSYCVNTKKLTNKWRYIAQSNSFEMRIACFFQHIHKHRWNSLQLRLWQSKSLKMDGIVASLQSFNSKYSWENLERKPRSLENFLKIDSDTLNDFHFYYEETYLISSLARVCVCFLFDSTCIYIYLYFLGIWDIILKKYHRMIFTGHIWISRHITRHCEMSSGMSTESRLKWNKFHA